MVPVEIPSHAAYVTEMCIPMITEKKIEDSSNLLHSSRIADTKPVMKNIVTNKWSKFVGEMIFAKSEKASKADASAETLSPDEAIGIRDVNRPESEETRMARGSAMASKMNSPPRSLPSKIQVAKRSPSRVIVAIAG